MPNDVPNREPAEISMCETQLQKTWEDILLMVDYAKNEGKVVPVSIRDAISAICYPSPAENGGPSRSETVTNMRTRLSQALEVHGALCELIAPVTPVTIRASKSDGILWVDNLTIRILLSVSLLSLAAFLASAVWKGLNLSGASGSVIDLIMLVTAAGLGSGFYGLYTAHKYIVSSTFDPKYTQIYIVRYVLGLTSGSILGYFGSTIIGTTGAHKLQLEQLGPAVLALVGGYAAEAVSQILQRVAETLVTVVRGTDEDAIEARQSELEAKGKQRDAQRKIALLTPLQEAKEALATQGTVVSPQAQAALQKAIDCLIKP